MYINGLFRRHQGEQLDQGHRDVLPRGGRGALKAGGGPFEPDSSQAIFRSRNASMACSSLARLRSFSRWAIMASSIPARRPGRFAVAGFSLGGYVAQQVCRQVADRIAGVALIDSGARADSEDTKETRTRMIRAVAAATATFAQVAEGLADRIVHPSRLNDRELLQLLADMASSVGAEGFVRQQQAARDRADSRDVLPGLRVPALVACGREDQVTPLFLSDEMATLLPDAEQVVVEQAGHMSILEQPHVVVAAVLAWLGRVDGARE